MLVVGKTDAEYVRKGVEEYEKRVKHYVPFEMRGIPDVRRAKNAGEARQKELEGEAILAQVETSDFVTLLDERGEELTSKEFAKFLSQKMVGGVKRPSAFMMSMISCSFFSRYLKAIW